MILRALTSLYRPHRDALIAVYYQQQPITEAAGALGLTAAGVAGRLLAALQELRDVLTRWGYTIPDPAPSCP